MRKLKEHNIDEDVNWQSNIEKAELNDDSWNVKVIMIEASEIEQENMYLKEFERGAAQGNRFVIKNISKIETLFMIKQLGGQNKTVRIFTEAQSYLKDNKNIPAEVLALIIKHLILTLKEEYLYVVKQKESVKEGLKQESEIMIDKVEVRAKIETRHKKSADSSTSKHKSSVEKKGSSSIAETDDAKKYHTALRMRGEEWRDKEHLEDFPGDGPNVYVALTGFAEPLLPGCLIRIGVPLIAIVKLVIDSKTVRTPSKLSRNIKSDTDMTKKSRMFWEGLQTCRLECDRDTLKNTAMVVFFPSLFDGDMNLNDPDIMVNNQEKIYDEMCYLMYDLQDLTRQHAHFLNNFQVTLIPDDKPDERLQRDYNRNNAIPLESTYTTTIYSILDDMLKAVSKTGTIKRDFNNKLAATNYILEKNNSIQAELFIEEVFSKLRNNDTAKREYRVTQKNEFENEQNPIIIQFGDKLRCSTFHLSECNLYDAIWPMLQGLPIVNLWQFFEKPSRESQAFINFHTNLLSSFFDRKLEIPELNKLIQILNCTKLYNVRNALVDQALQHSSTCPRKRLLKRSYKVEPLSQDPLIKIGDFNSTVNKKILQSSHAQTLFGEESRQEFIHNPILNCHTLRELLNNKINISNRQCCIDDYEYFEEFKGIVGLQVLNDAYRQFHSCIYNYCAVTDTLNVMFWNGCNNTGLSREEWRGHIATPVCLQDFFEFVFDEKYDWIQNEEKRYEQSMNKTATKVAKEQKKTVISGCCDDTDEFDFIIEGSLKHRDILDYFLESSPDIQESVLKISSLSSSKLHSRISIISSRLSRRSKMFIPSLTSSESSIVDASLQEKFYGYNLCDRRVEAIGKESAYFSKDGSIIISKYTSFLHCDSKYLSLNVVVDKNEFWIHRIVGGDTESVDSSEAFRICTRDKISVSIKKRKQTTGNKLDSINFTENSTNILTDVEVVSYSLSLVWPNGHMTETIHDGKNELSYIKQSFSLPLSEDKRCISMNGEVIIFKKNGNINILQSAGAYINVLKYEKRTKSEIDSQEIHHEEVRAEKVNKNVGKHDRKDTNENTKQPGYEFYGKDPSQFTNNEPELIFHEYETVDSSGIYQKWTQGVLLDEQKLLSRTATDYCLGEVLTKRSDGTIIFLNEDGNLVTTYPNNTKITTSYFIESEDIYPEYSVYELDFNEQIIINKNELYLSIQIVYTIEHPDFTTVTINKSDNSVSIESQKNMFVTLTNNNIYDFHFDDHTNAKFSGEYLTIYTNSVQRENVCSVNVKCNTEDYETVDKVWLHMKDSFDKDIIVDKDGEIDVTETNVSDEKDDSDEKTAFDTFKRLQEAKAVKFYVLKRDLSVAELVHRDLVKEYKETYSDVPWSSSKVFNSFGDYRNLLSIVTPIPYTPSEIWKMNSKFCNKPRRLVYKDLKLDGGKGFYHWMRPYKIYEPKSIAPVDLVQKSLPKAYVLRTLERLWDDNNKPCLRNAQELITALEKYSRAVESNEMYYANPPLEDFRCDEEIFKDDILQKLSHRVYEDLAKQRAAAGIELSKPTTITTRPLSTSTDRDNVKDTESLHETVVKGEEAVSEMKPRLKEYWRRRKQDYEEEQRNKYLLREGQVPPYFRNILGGASWLEDQKL